VGPDADWKGFKVTFQHRWTNFKEDSPTATYITSPGAFGAAPGDLTTLSSFNRAEPYHGNSPGWLGTLYTDRKWFAISARATYVGGIRNFVLDESAIGVDRFAAAQNRQVLVTGDARRPVTTGDFSLSLFPTGRLTVVNNTSVHSTRIDGDSYYTEFNNATLDTQTINFRYLGIRTVSNTTSANYRATDWLSFYARYGYSNRQIRDVEGFGAPGSALDNQTYEQENTLHTGGAGFRLKPLKPLTINLDGEIGRASNPFTPISDRNFHTIGARVEYRGRRYQLSSSYRQVYNINAPLPLSAFSSHARDYSASASWFAKAWFSVDASYSKLHLDTASGLVFFAGAIRNTLQTGDSSLYTSNIHAGNIGAHFAIRKRVDVYAGFTATRDTGDGRSSQAPAGATDPILINVLAPAQTFPLAFYSPLARVSIRISPKVRWNAGWQFYRYREDFHILSVDENYRAHTGYVSLLWSF